MIIQGDIFDIAPTLEAESISTIITSPPYWAKRDYGHPDQIGLEPTFSQYVEKITQVFRLLWPALKADGTLWLNIGDSYVVSNGRSDSGSAYDSGPNSALGNKVVSSRELGLKRQSEGLPTKSLIGIPWRVAFALQDDGWILRQEIIWQKPDAMPFSGSDRCTTSHEHIFLFTKQEQYHFNQDRIREPMKSKNPSSTFKRSNSKRGVAHVGQQVGTHRPNRADTEYSQLGRNCRSVWTFATSRYRGNHGATFPVELPRRCIKAGCPADGVVLDPFLGSGATAVAAIEAQVDWVGVELNEDYINEARGRLSGVQLGLNV